MSCHLVIGEVHKQEDDQVYLVHALHTYNVHRPYMKEFLWVLFEYNMKLLSNKGKKSSSKDLQDSN